MTELKHHGVKGMKWGNRKSYDKVGYMPGKIEKNRIKRLVEKRKNQDAIRRIKNDKSKTDRVNELRKRNDEISNINNKADVRLPKSKRNVRRVKNVAAMAGTASAAYATTPQGQQKIVNAARRVKDLYDFRNLNMRRR